MPDIALAEIRHPDDPHLPALHRLMAQLFVDPNLVFALDRLQEFVSHARSPDRCFHILTARREDELLGGTIFSYLPGSACGFSEYVMLAEGARGRGLGRALFEERRRILDADAATCGQSRCAGLFIETESPVRTPPAILAQEAAVSLDPWERWRIFAHLGFRRCDCPYVHVPLGPGQAPVDYLDLLFAPWAPAAPAAVPSARIRAALAPMWQRWVPHRLAEAQARFDRLVGDREVALFPLFQSAVKEETT